MSGKAIYHTEGKAAEYSEWACNFFVGCSGGCRYCFNKHGRSAAYLGKDTPTLKRCFQTIGDAIDVFEKELIKNIDELRKKGIFFSFITDPMLEDTIDCTIRAALFCKQWGVPVTILTKQIWWLDSWAEYLSFCKIGFTLTGHDEMERGCASNLQRVEAINILNRQGFKTWASIEPIIDFKDSLQMIRLTMNYCDHYKIGLKSGEIYKRSDTRKFISDVCDSIYNSESNATLYFKDSIINASGITRDELNEECPYCVDSDHKF